MPTLIVNCVSVAIAFIPEGLPIALTAGLTITANLMRKSKVLCKSLKTVETLGCVSVICSDKTGTLTEGKMTVTECLIGGQVNMSVGESSKSSSSSSSSDSSAVHQLRALATLCNGAELDNSEGMRDLPITQRPVFGDATDTAILRFAEILEKDITPFLRSCWTRTYELAFNSKNKFMIRTFSSSRAEGIPQVLSQEEASSFGDDYLYVHLSNIPLNPFYIRSSTLTPSRLLTIKGAPDVLINRCTHYITPTGHPSPLDAAKRASFEQAKNTYSSQGKRCILLARKVLSKAACGDPASSAYERVVGEQASGGLTLVGLVAIVDPLRPEIVEVVRTLRGAGVRIAMVTGDFALTALAIARDAGIVTTHHVHEATALTRFPTHDTDSSNSTTLKPTTQDQDSSFSPSAIVISGPELLSLNEQQWASLTAYEEIVFARTTPEQKLRIVREFQGKGHVVAMTGDGVNDAPSLKAADVGISMGSGSDIAMEAADMVLLESFSSVVTALQYGRVVFDNLKKVRMSILHKVKMKQDVKLTCCTGHLLSLAGR